MIPNVDNTPDIVSRYYNPEQSVSRACIRELTYAVHLSLAKRRSDSEFKFGYKTAWSKILNPIIIELNQMYRDFYREENKDDSDYLLFHDVFEAEWNWRNPSLQMPLGKAIHKSFFKLVDTLIRCIRSSYHFISKGGKNGLHWEYQQNLIKAFDKLLTLIGEKKKVEYEVKDGEDIIINTRTVEELMEKINLAIPKVKEKIEYDKAHRPLNKKERKKLRKELKKKGITELPPELTNQPKGKRSKYQGKNKKNTDKYSKIGRSRIKARKLDEQMERERRQQRINKYNSNGRYSNYNNDRYKSYNNNNDSSALSIHATYPKS
jgi:hypothetical protein